jgi:hypothetical protein
MLWVEQQGAFYQLPREKPAESVEFKVQSSVEQHLLHRVASSKSVDADESRIQNSLPYRLEAVNQALKASLTSFLRYSSRLAIVDLSEIGLRQKACNLVTEL